jgi:transposase InsO family protein
MMADLSGAEGKPRYVPVKNPQSNALSEAFMNTLAREYGNITPLPDAATVFGLIAVRFEDYNEKHPHSGLKTRSPLECIAAKSATA